MNAVRRRKYLVSVDKLLPTLGNIRALLTWTKGTPGDSFNRVGCNTRPSLELCDSINLITRGDSSFTSFVCAGNRTQVRGVDAVRSNR